MTTPVTSPSDDTVYGVGPRVQRFLRKVVPAPRAKSLAAVLPISVPLANKLLQGYAPRMWLFEEMVALYGEPFLRAIFAEAFTASDDRLQKLTAEVTALRERVTVGASPVDGVAEGDAARVVRTGDDDPETTGAWVALSELVFGLVATIPAGVRKAQIMDEAAP